MIFDDNIQR